MFNVFMDCPFPNVGAVKSSLIDSDGENPNEAQGFGQRERLSERTPKGDAIVRSQGNMNSEKPTEMIGSRQFDGVTMRMDNCHKLFILRRFGFFFDGLALPVGGY